MDALVGHQIGSKHIRGLQVNRLQQRKSYIWSYWKYFEEVLKIFELWKIVSKSFQCQFASSLRSVRNLSTCGHKSYFEVKCCPLVTKVNHPFEILKILFQHAPHSTSILESFDSNWFYLHVPLSTSWDHICQMKHANDKKGKYCAMDILPFWIFGQNSSLIRFKHENMCQPHHGGRPPLCCFYACPNCIYLNCQTYLS